MVGSELRRTAFKLLGAISFVVSDIGVTR